MKDTEVKVLQSMITEVIDNIHNQGQETTIPLKDLSDVLEAEVYPLTFGALEFHYALINVADDHKYAEFIPQKKETLKRIAPGVITTEKSEKIYLHIY